MVGESSLPELPSGAEGDRRSALWSPLCPNLHVTLNVTGSIISSVQRKSSFEWCRLSSQIKSVQFLELWDRGTIGVPRSQRPWLSAGQVRAGADCTPDLGCSPCEMQLPSLLHGATGGRCVLTVLHDLPPNRGRTVCLRPERAWKAWG